MLRDCTSVMAVAWTDLAAGVAEEVEEEDDDDDENAVAES